MTDKQFYITLSVLIAIILFITIPLFIGLFYLDSFKVARATEDTPKQMQESTAQNFDARAHVQATTTSTVPVQKNISQPPLSDNKPNYIRVIDGCGIHFEGECLNVRSGPGTEYPVVMQLRNDIVLKVGESIENDGVTWFKIIFDEGLRYPERVGSNWYVSSKYVEAFYDQGEITEFKKDATSSIKKIIVSRSKQQLHAYENDVLFMETDISTGLELSPTPRGTFSIYKKTPSRYMQGPITELGLNQYYDLPGVPWNLYFTKEGAVIHGAYWHNKFGSPYSHGCVNLLPDLAKKLYQWADVGTKVIVED